MESGNWIEMAGMIDHQSLGELAWWFAFAEMVARYVYADERSAVEWFDVGGEA